MEAEVQPVPSNTCNLAELPRGVAPRILLEHVRNTAPFVFDAEFAEKEIPYIRVLRRVAQNPESALSHLEYFELCLSAHHASVATFVPTDVDNQIRFKLWNPVLPTETLVRMAGLVLESLHWDHRAVSTRWVKAPQSGQILSGHAGEWFSTAAGAYAALRKRAPEDAARVAGAVLGEVQRHAAVFEEFKKARDGIGLSKTATLIAHNLGDLDRVFEMWNIPEEDPLRIAVFKCGHPSDRDAPGTYRAILSQAGSLNKAHMAHENHRHFALRSIKPLRRSADLLLPIGPYFDDWGARVARHPALSPTEIGSVIDALTAGWERLQAAAESPAVAPLGYARALSGILENFPGGFHAVSSYIPARVERNLKSGPLRTQIAVPKKRFEEQRNQMALNLVLGAK